MSTLLQCEAINARVKTDPVAFICEENERYHQRVQRVANTLLTEVSGRGLVLLCGPSASGKTTTAALLQRFLQVRLYPKFPICLFHYGHVRQ